MSMSFLNTARLSTRTLGRGLALRTTSRVPVRSFMSLKTSKVHFIRCVRDVFDPFCASMMSLLLPKVLHATEARAAMVSP